MHHTTFRRHKQLNSRLNFIGHSVPPLFTGLVFHQSLNRLFQERITAPFNNMRTSKLNWQMRFSLPSIKCSAAPSSFRLLPSAVHIMTLVKRTNLKLIIALLMLLFLSIIRFLNEEWNIQTETRSHTRFLIRWIHATGTLEFDRFPALHKPLPTGNRFSHCLVFASAFLMQSLPFSLIKMLKVFSVFFFFLFSKSW